MIWPSNSRSALPSYQSHTRPGPRRLAADCLEKKEKMRKTDARSASIIFLADMQHRIRKRWSAR